MENWGVKGGGIRRIGGGGGGGNKGLKISIDIFLSFDLFRKYIAKYSREYVTMEFLCYC